MRRAVALYFRVRNGKPPEMIDGPSFDEETAVWLAEVRPAADASANPDGFGRAIGADDWPGLNR